MKRILIATDVGLIVVGSRGHGALASALLGCAPYSSSVGWPP